MRSVYIYRMKEEKKFLHWHCSELPDYPRSFEVSEIAFTLASLENPRYHMDIKAKWYT